MNRHFETHFMDNQIEKIFLFLLGKHEIINVVSQLNLRTLSVNLYVHRTDLSKPRYATSIFRENTMTYLYFV